MENLVEIKEFIWTYILPPLCFIGLFTNAINVLVFAQKKKLKNSIYKYFLCHSVVDLVYLFFCFVRFLLKLDHLSYFTYWPQLYEILVYGYFTSALAMMMVFIQLIIAIKRLLIVVNINLTVKLKFRYIITICAILSFLIYLPIPLSNTLVFMDMFSNQTVDFSNALSSHRVITTLHIESWMKNKTLAIFNSIAPAFRGLVAPVLMMGLNIALLIKFRKLAVRKSNLKGVVRSTVTEGE